MGFFVLFQLLNGVFEPIAFGNRSLDNLVSLMLAPLTILCTKVSIFTIHCDIDAAQFLTNAVD